ncbi:MAG: hypothetical protein JWN93_31 [Hyphomicrobiales bacterium]|nr:hypothetical protein [Hyphomicrobiales bacterium]
MKLKFGKGDWIVVCDGAKALILENAGDATFPNFQTREAREEHHASTRDMGSDAPGRVHQSFGGARSSVEQTDWHDDTEVAFLQKLAASLEQAAAQHQVRKVHIVAPPRALGVLRQAYGDALRGVLGEEVAKDLAHAPVHEIERLLTGGAPGTG